jgi:hypothetical protein
LNAETKPVPCAQDLRRNRAEPASTDVPGNRIEFEPIAISMLAPHRERDRLIESQRPPSLDHRMTLSNSASMFSAFRFFPIRSFESRTNGAASLQSLTRRYIDMRALFKWYETDHRTDRNMGRICHPSRYK